MNQDTIRILMLEDSATDAELVQYFLRKNFRPAEIQLAMTEAEFEEKLKSFQPHVVLSDNSLPQFDAATALEKVRRLYNGIAFIMVTGTVSEEFAAGIIREGADDYILKDRLTRLPAAIDAALHKLRQEEEKRYAMEQLIQSEEKLRVFIERVTDGFISIDKDLHFTYLNKQAGILNRRPVSEMIGKKITEVFPDAEDSETYKAFQTALREQRYISNIDYYAPLDLWMENHIYPSPDGLSVFTRDISEKKRLEKELQEQENKLQLEKLAVSMAAEEKVRNLIGAELHDNVNQLLASANVYLSVIRDKPGRVEELIHNCISSIKQAIHETRRLAHELVAPDLKSESLIMQVEMLCETMLEPAGITAEIKHDQFKESQVSQDRLLALYRILQEQCSNILKYAEATQVSIRFETDPNKRTIMHIKDNGKGMDPTAQRSGIGLRNIATRIEVFGGTMRIETGAGQGFLLEVVLE